MMLTIHGLPVMVKYHDLKTLIKQECKMNDFILDNLVTDVDGYKKVRIGVADESEGAHLTKCLNGFRMGGNVLRVVAKGSSNQPNNFEQPGGFIPRNDAPNLPGNFGNQPMPLMGNRTGSWGPGTANPANQWGVNQQPQTQIPQNTFGFQQVSGSQQFPQQQQPGLPLRLGNANKPFNQSGPFNPIVQNHPPLDKGFGFGSTPNNPPSQSQGPRRSDRGHVLRNVELVPEMQRSQQMNRFQQENVEQNKPVTINKDYFQGSNQFNEPQQKYPQGGQTGPWNKQPNQQQKGPHFDDRAGDRRLPRKSPGRRDSPPPKRMSPLMRRESPGRRFSPSRRHPEKGYPEAGSQSKPIRPAYEPDGKTPSQAMYSGGYRQNVHDAPYPGPGGRQMDQREPTWQQDRDKNVYPGHMKKQDDDRRDARMPGSRGPETIEGNRPSPMHKSRSPSRRDIRERSPVRDRYKRHSPSPRSPRRSWALEKRRSPDINQAPPPPMWPGQNLEEQHGRNKGESGKHVPVWDHRTLAETEEAMRRDSRVYAEDRMRRDMPNLRQPSPRRHGFKPPEERFSPKPNRDSKFEARDPKFEPRDPKFDPRDNKFEPRDPKFDPRDNKFDPRDPKFDLRDPKFDHRDPKFEPRGAKFEPRDPQYERVGAKFESRDPKFEPRNPKFEPRDAKFDQRDTKFETRDPKFETRDTKFDQRNPKFEPSDFKYNRDGPKFEQRDPKYNLEPKFEPRDPKYDRGEPKFEPRDPKYVRGEPKFEQCDPKFDSRNPKFEARDPKYDHRDPKYEPRDHKFEPRDHNFETRDPKFEPREYEHRDVHKMRPTNQPNFDTRGPRFEPRDPKFDPHVTNFEQRQDSKFGNRGPIFEPRDPKYDTRDQRFEPRNDKFEVRDVKYEPHGPPGFEHREKYEPRGPKFEERDPKFELRNPKFEPRDAKFEPRESKFKSTFEPVDPPFKERESDPRDMKYTSRDHRFEGRDRKYDGRVDYKDRNDIRDNNDPLDVKFSERDSFREHHRSDDRHYREEFLPRREEFKRDDRKESRQSHEEFQKEFEDIYKRTVEFKQKVRELRRSDKDREYSREDRRRGPERDDRRNPADSLRSHSPHDIERHHGEPRSRREERSRSPHYDESRKRYDDEKVKSRASKKGSLAPEFEEKRNKAVDSIVEKMMEKYGNFEMDNYAKYRVKETLKNEISRILHEMFGTKDVSFIEMVVKFNSKHDERAEQNIFDEVMASIPNPEYKAMKRSAQDSERSAVPAKTSKRSPDHDVNLKKDTAPIIENQVQRPRRPQASTRAKPSLSSKPTVPKRVVPAKKVAPSEVKTTAPIPAKPNADGYYELTPLLSKTLEEELQKMMSKVMRELPDYAPSQEENIVIDKLRSEATDSIKNILGLNVTKRLLNVFNPLSVKVYFSTKPDRKYLRNFLKRFNFVAFKRIAKVTNTFAAQVKSIADYDELCNTKKIFCGAAKITITPCYRFAQCPKALKTIYGTTQVDNKEMDTSIDDMDVSKESNKLNDSQDITDAIKEEGKTENLEQKNAPNKTKEGADNLAKSEDATGSQSNKPIPDNVAVAPNKEAVVTPSTTVGNIPNTTKTTNDSNTSAQSASSQDTNQQSAVSKPTSKETVPVKPATIPASNTETKQSATSSNANSQKPVAKPTTGQTTFASSSENNQLASKSANTAINQTTVSKPTSVQTPAPKPVAKPTSNQAPASKPTSGTPTSKPTNTATTVSEPNATETCATKPTPHAKPTSGQTTAAKPAASQVSATKPGSQTPISKTASSKTPVSNPSSAQAPASKTNNQTPVSKPTSTPAKPSNHASAKPATSVQKTPIRTTRTKAAALKTAPISKPKIAQKSVNKASKKPFSNERIASKSYMNKDDFEELDDHDILALMSGGIILDECSGSEDE